MKTKAINTLTTVLLASCIGSRMAAQASATTSGLENKVKSELEISYNDYPEPGESLMERLLRLGDRLSISQVLLNFVRNYKNEGPKGPNYRYLVDSINALRVLRDPEAVPEFRSIAVSSLYPSNGDAKFYAITAVAEIDPLGNKELLLEALHDSYYPIRAAAAAGLSKVDDMSVVYELEVAAAREPSRGGSLRIQNYASAMRARLSANPKKK